MQVNILGRMINIKLLKEEDMDTQELWGEYLSGKDEIQLNAGHKTPASLYLTLLHEILHATIDRIGIDLDFQCEEILVKSIENTFKDNFILVSKNNDINELFSKKNEI